LDVRSVVDIGANRGQFALLARHVFPNAKIVSFEPLAKPAAKFRAIFANDKGVVLHEAAIGSTRGDAVIHVSRQDDSSSLLPITEMQDRLFPGTAEAGRATVHIGPLSEFLSPEEISQPALLKLDVQGYELHALSGCEDLLDRFQYVYAECSFVELYEGQSLADEIIRWLDKKNFTVSGIYNTTYDRAGKAIQGDFLFERRSGRDARASRAVREAPPVAVAGLPS
jgi:FkbM family methyltransferase